MMTAHSSSSRQPDHETWMLECLHLERACALGVCLEHSTTRTYASTFLSYSAFCQCHGFPICPTADTLSFFMVYMCHFIQPSSVKSYLSGICAKLEAHWPDACEIRKSHLVTQTLAACMYLH